MSTPNRARARRRRRRIRQRALARLLAAQTSGIESDGHRGVVLAESGPSVFDALCKVTLEAARVMVDLSAAVRETFLDVFGAGRP